jgi:hypothetical protein
VASASGWANLGGRRIRDDSALRTRPFGCIFHDDGDDLLGSRGAKHAAGTGPDGQATAATPHPRQAPEALQLFGKQLADTPGAKEWNTWRCSFFLREGSHLCLYYLAPNGIRFVSAITE